jgi:hypothetical protein
MRRHLTTPFLLASLLVSAAVPASASTLTFTSSPTVTGLSFTIENQGLVDGSTDTYKILLSLTTDGFTGTGDYLSALSLDFSATALDTGTTLFNQPPDQDWVLKSLTPHNKAVGNNGCNANEPGSLCIEETASPAASSNLNLKLSGSNIYSWLFYVDLGTGSFASTTTLTIQTADLRITGAGSNANWHDPSNLSFSTGSLARSNGGGDNGGGDPPPPPPPPPHVVEPGSLVLLGLGLMAAAFGSRRRQRP